MQQRVMNPQLEWELSQCSLDSMGQHSSPLRKVSAKRFPPEMVGQPEIGQKYSWASLISPQEKAHYSHTAQSRKQAFISQMGMNDYSAVVGYFNFAERALRTNDARGGLYTLGPKRRTM